MSKRIDEIWTLLSNIPDPEIPVISITELGVVKDVQLNRLSCSPGNEGIEVIVTVTPTYTGCPAMDMMRMQIRMALLQAGYKHITLKQQLSPAWTTDWMSDEAKEKLRRYGIAPPVGKSMDAEVLETTVVACPRCNSENTKLVSAFSSTACKAFYHCLDCGEPFDHFKCH